MLTLFHFFYSIDVTIQIWRQGGVGQILNGRDLGKRLYTLEQNIIEQLRNRKLHAS